MTEAEQQLKRWEKKQKSTCLNEVATVLQRLRRLEEAGDDGYCACVTCGVVRKWNDGIQGGHYITRTCTSTKLEESNIWPQCAICNNAKGGHGQQVTRAYDRFMGDRAEPLEAVQAKWKGKPFPYTKKELAEKIVKFRQRVKQQEKRLGI